MLFYVVFVFTFTFNLYCDHLPTSCHLLTPPACSLLYLPTPEGWKA